MQPKPIRIYRTQKPLAKIYLTKKEVIMEDWKGKHLIETAKPPPVDLSPKRAELLDIRREKVRRMFNEGLGMVEIGAQLGLSRSTVRYDLNVLGLRTGRKSKQSAWYS